MNITLKVDFDIEESLIAASGHRIQKREICGYINCEYRRFIPFGFSLPKR